MTFSTAAPGEPAARLIHRHWMGVTRNLIAALAAIVLAGILSQVDVFRQASLGPNGLSAAQLVYVLGYGVALVLIWLSARSAAFQIPGRSPALRLLRHALLPVATLLILSGAYRLIHPFLGERAALVFSWLLVLPLVAAAVWLGFTLYEHADGLVLAGEAVSRRFLTTAERATRGCRACGATSPLEAKFCCACGAYLEGTAGGTDRTETAGKGPSPGRAGPA